MTAGERRKRDRELVADRARGMTWPELAARYELSERQAQRVVERWWSRQGEDVDVSSDDVVRETLAAFAQDLNDLAVRAVETQNDAVKLGAIKARGDVFRGRIEVLRSIGRLPRDWTGWLGALETRALLHRFVAVLERRGVDDATLDELRAVIDEAEKPTLKEAA